MRWEFYKLHRENQGLLIGEIEPKIESENVDHEFVLKEVTVEKII